MDDALQTTTALINKLGAAFAPYLDATMPFVLQSLRNHDKIEV